ncbi:MAG TPA: hypothetical protein VII23_15780 [Terriglobales bacterium]
MNRYLTSLGSNTRVRTLRELIKFNEDHREQEIPYFGQDLLLQAEATRSLNDSRLREGD